MKKIMSINELASFNGGRLAAVFAQELNKVAADCYDRPGVKAKRTLKLAFNVSLRINADGSCDTVTMEFVAKTSLPELKSREIDMELRPSGDLVFNDESPSDVRQQTLDEANSGE